MLPRVGRAARRPSAAVRLPELREPAAIPGPTHPFPAGSAGPPLMDLLQRDDLSEWMDPPLWGVIHLLPLPGSPGYGGDPDAPLRRALLDAGHLENAGFGGLLVENFGDLPFHGETVPPETVAAMARIVAAVRERHPQCRVGVNCLRNDASAALAIAATCGADAIRVNVHTGAALTDQGLLEGRAARTLRARRALGAEQVRIMADVLVKHAAPLAPRPVEVEASDLRQRGQADALLITGSGTGRAADLEQVTAVRTGAPGAPVLVASGVTPETAAAWAATVDGAIVGSCLMHGGRAGAGVDPDRARALVLAWEEGRAASR